MSGTARLPPGSTAMLLVLASGYFVVGVASLAVVGVLGPMGRDLGVAPSAAAGLVTAFALAFAVVAPTAQAALARFALPAIMIAGLVGLAAGTVATALARDYTTALAARILTGAAAALVGPSASSIAAARVPPAARGQALGLVFGGLTVATVAGVPLAAWLGGHLSWRMVFVCVAAAALLAAVLVRTLVPRDAGAGRTSAGRTSAGLADMLALARGRVVGAAVLAAMLQMAAQFITYALIGRLLSKRFGAAPDAVALALLVFGGAGVLGNIAAARLTDRIGANLTLRVSVMGMALSFVVLALAAPSFPAALAALAGWAVFGLMFQAPQQKRLAAAAQERTPVALGLNAAALYLGMAGGSALGGVVYAGLGPAALPVASLAATVLCGLCAELAARR
jgi:DHA1 family inner membrane transport protein